MPKTEPFEQDSERYDEWFERNRDIYSAELEAVRNLMPSSPWTGLEVGVGSGRFAVPLGIRVGVEPAAMMAMKAEHRGIRVIRGVAERLPFPDMAFDLVLMVTTICFVDDVRGSFREAWRVLRPRGCIVVGFIDRESQLGKQYDENRGSSVFYKDATFFSPREVAEYLTVAGFGDLTFRQTLVPGEKPAILHDGFGDGAFVVVRAVRNG